MKQPGDALVEALVLAGVGRRYAVKEFPVFGSATPGDMDPQSDIDIMVEFAPSARTGIAKFEAFVEELSHKPGTRFVMLVQPAPCLQCFEYSHR